MDVVTTTVGLLVVATIVALIARRLAFPYTVGLVVTGIGLALTRNGMGVVLTHEFIFDVILPPLLFEAAVNLHWKELRRDALPILNSRADWHRHFSRSGGNRDGLRFGLAGRACFAIRRPDRGNRSGRRHCDVQG